jgi:hypothetical protein
VLGCLVLVKGIETNPDKIKAIMHMKPPESRKDVQKLTERIAALNRFTSKLAEQSIPADQAVLAGMARACVGLRPSLLGHSPAGT